VSFLDADRRATANAERSNDADAEATGESRGTTLDGAEGRLSDLDLTEVKAKLCDPVEKEWADCQHG